MSEKALEYHRRPPRGKIVVNPSKPTATQQDLVLAYTPGVAAPCLAIADDPQLVYEYTARGNLVAVVTNGSAVLGLGNIGPEASKPVMEGKSVLFKRFANIDVFDLELNCSNEDHLINVVEALEPTFGGINLEDIKAPECFKIEAALRERMNIPVFHDDQHGTAIITGAALCNALELSNKKIDQIKVVFCGAGAAGIGCARFYLSLGVKKENITLVDIHGVVHSEREDLFKELRFFAQTTSDRTLADAVKDADVFVGVSAPGVLSEQMLRTMADQPILFTLANPDPEIAYPLAKEVRPDAIIATGRSDYPNQVNNVLCFPFIFRGALDVRAREINEQMKMAACQALANLVKEDTPDEVLIAYGLKSLHYGKDYLIPTPFDPRVLQSVAPAVAKAAIESGVAQIEMVESSYREQLAISQSITQQTAQVLIRRAKAAPKKRVVFPEGWHETILRACHQIVQEDIAKPLIVGDATEIQEKAEEWRVSLNGVEVLDIASSPLRDQFSKALFQHRARKGMEKQQSEILMKRPTEFALMLLKSGQADCFVGGISRSYPRIVRPALQIIGLKDTVKTVSGFYMLLYRDRRLFLSDTTVNTYPSAEALAEIAINTARAAQFFGEEPKIAFISYSNFGSVRSPDTTCLTDALALVRKRAPDLMADGEMQGHLAINAELRQDDYPFSTLEGSANILIFHNLHAANSAYRLLSELSDGEILGPILTGMRQPVNLLPQEVLVQDVVNITALSVLEAEHGTL